MFESYNNVGAVYFTNENAAAEPHFWRRFITNRALCRRALMLDCATCGKRAKPKPLESSIGSLKHRPLPALTTRRGLAYEPIGRKREAVKNYQRGLELTGSESLGAELHAGVARLRQDGN